MKISSQMQRRLLVNYRVDPDVMTPQLPPGFGPHLVNGWAVAGICLVRLADIRPYGLPSAFGITSENAAHRIAVEWDTLEGKQTGVYIPRRDTGSALTVLAGGRLFPGTHQRARFDVEESRQRVRVAYASNDGTVMVDAEVSLTGELHGSRLFPDLEAASKFFQESPVGLSPGRGDQLEGVELHTQAWSIEAADPVRVRSSFFDDRTRFPPGSATLDSALVMREVPVTWTADRSVRAASAARTA